MDLKVKVECHCRLTSFSLSIPSDSLPLKSALCHCHSCRHCTGQLFATWAVIPTDLPPSVLNGGNLVKYESSPTCQRWFCKRCGASVVNVDRGEGPEEWEVGTGVLYFEDPKHLEGKLNRVQLWVEDVKGDGGTVGWINQGKLEGMDRHWKGRQSNMVNDDAVRDLMRRRGDDQDDCERLIVQCHCQNVKLEISKPSNGHNAGAGKFEASLDACTSCRTVTGFEITCWATVPKTVIVAEPDLESLLVDKGRLGYYSTSSGVSRFFCVRCGATVFYYKHDLETIDVGLGLLEPKVEGAVRVESWLEWQKYPKCLVFEEDAIDTEFVSNLKEGMRNWERS
ncbi:uncharacterized protein Z519_04882 [Cladophialophora bantiana CBS 173.52]|uniref:CENP-V/GFA domain-containing protein n=1 Tax=Cladophialophora bantiana (strain ATCC 10958 / CBS 173.52 / CDC B-1940 / NIH 8579) TaxID=1442370 RepID=A0A0D2IDQ8_CLAB1|nr:uncharacterized protein Z519_04882 [Cladophialophora bantiana CBS 173.52]KIW94904.1 hypothetical protein Z519_04882 [Cladophialophora bantiana CBS 173.52]